MNRKLNVLDLFAGAGGFSLGFFNAGFKIVGALEINKIYAQTHERNFKESTTICGDIRDWPPSKFADITGIMPSEIDIIIGGPPCQTFSSIGKPKINSIGGDLHKGNHRTYLYENFLEYIEFYKPKAFIMENVPTMKSKDKGKLFQEISDKIKKLKYTHHTFILNSVNFGVPQLRRRLFIIGFKKKTEKYSGPVPTHYEPKDEVSQKKKLKKYTTINDALTDLPNIYDGIRAGDLPYSKKTSLTTYQKIMRGGKTTVGNNVCRVSNERAKKVFKHMKQGDKYMDLPSEVRSILPFREDIFHDRLKRLSLDAPSWTILAHIGMDGYMYIHPTEDRTISVREAARIQSFNDKFEFFGNMREQYIQVGNSVPPLLAQAIANSLKPFLES